MCCSWVAGHYRGSHWLLSEKACHAATLPLKLQPACEPRQAPGCELQHQPLLSVQHATCNVSRVVDLTAACKGAWPDRKVASRWHVRKRINVLAFHSVQLCHLAHVRISSHIFPSILVLFAGWQFQMCLLRSLPASSAMQQRDDSREGAE